MKSGTRATRRKNSGNLQSIPSVTLPLFRQSLLFFFKSTDMMVVEQSWKTLVSRSFLYFSLFGPLRARCELIVSLPMGEVMWNPREPARAHLPAQERHL